MSSRLRLICHGATSATRVPAFPRDEDLDEKGLLAAARLARPIRADNVAYTSPALRARRTAAALGLDAAVAEALRDLDVGRWAGLSLADIGLREPEALAAWLSDPAAAPHGGETIEALLVRIHAWLKVVGACRSCIAVTHPAVIRAAILSALGAPASGFWRIDIAPLAVVELRGGPGRWTLRSLARSRAA